MQDVKKRIKSSPLYGKAVRLLDRRNFRSITPMLGDCGTIDLKVWLQDRHGKDKTVTLNVPQRLNHLSFLAWEANFKRQIEELEKSGLRPHPSQFQEMRDREVFQGSPPPAPPKEPMIQSVFSKPKTPVKTEAEVPSTEDRPRPKLEATFRVSIPDLPLILGDPRLQTIISPSDAIELTFLTEATDLGSIITEYNLMTLITAVPPRLTRPEPVPVAKDSPRETEKMTHAQVILSVMDDKPMDAGSIMERIGERYSSTPLTKKKVGIVVASMVKQNLLRRTGRGVFKKAH